MYKTCSSALKLQVGNFGQGAKTLQIQTVQVREVRPSLDVVSFSRNVSQSICLFSVDSKYPHESLMAQRYMTGGMVFQPKRKETYWRCSSSAAAASSNILLKSVSLSLSGVS